MTKYFCQISLVDFLDFQINNYHGYIFIGIEKNFLQTNFGYLIFTRIDDKYIKKENYQIFFNAKEILSEKNDQHLWFCYSSCDFSINDGLKYILHFKIVRFTIVVGRLYFEKSNFSPRTHLLRLALRSTCRSLPIN